MTRKEHELIMTMFARVYETIGIIQETLKSRELWTGDDALAFSHATHADQSKLLRYAKACRDDYVNFATHLGIPIPKD